ncbi:uncharacterized protein SCHCODRAFT_02622787 [Schizophyllum commune H4-8]|nr:uncharacterized protein SCHCODRAFT_02622787 [Schizophyllum commune H4-8]KAI5893806.1 hypothetical protein SCHCODRAFT_02622787 [Schizophyllum commune H4-8]
MATPRPASFDYTLQSRGKEAQMKLIGLSIQSLLFGTYLTLALAMFYLLRHRRAGWASTSTARHSTKGRLLVGLCILTTTLTGHWISLVIRSFQAFIYWHGAQQASMYYVESAGSIGIVRFAFHGANGLISDAFVISRFFIIWDYSKPVVVFPLVCLAGFSVTAIGTTYAYGVFDPSIPETLTSLHHWRLARAVPSLSINFYCTALVVWRLAHIRRQTMDHGISQSIKTALIIVVESAALNTTVILLSQIMYDVDNVSTYFLTDCVPYISALTAILIHARAVISNATGANITGRELQDGSSDTRPAGVWRSGNVKGSGGGAGSTEDHENRPSTVTKFAESSMKSTLEMTEVTRD